MATIKQREAADARAVERAAANIIAVYLDAPEATRAAGARWYAEEAARCEDFGRRHEIPARCVAGAAAAISPGMRWDAVFSHLDALRRYPGASVPTYSREFVRRAVKCLNGADPDKVLSGPKVTAFYKLLAREDLAAVVVDGHAWNICRAKIACFRRREDYQVPAAARITARRYRVAAAAYRRAAEELGIAPHAMQAATWLHWREEIRRRAPADVDAEAGS